MLEDANLRRNYIAQGNGLLAQVQAQRSLKLGGLDIALEDAESFAGVNSALHCK